MSVLSVQTKKIPELQATTGLVGSDMIIVELADYDTVLTPRRGCGLRSQS